VVRSLVLASASPQRRAILSQVGIPFDVRVSGVDEEEHGDPVQAAEENARRKAAAIDYAHYKEGVAATTLGADTVVALDGEILGKPADAAQARAYVARLAGRTHQVVGAIALFGGKQPLTAVEITRVHFRPADDALLDWYVETGEWQGRAGGYAIQGKGAVLVAGIEGDYLNVVGLPLQRLIDLAPDLLPTR
jgi:septum formation protein